MSIDPQIHPSWKKYLIDEFQKDYFIQIKDFLLKEKSENQTIYPKRSDIFNAFEFIPFENVKVVILGQDPYH